MGDRAHCAVRASRTPRTWWMVKCRPATSDRSPRSACRARPVVRHCADDDAARAAAGLAALHATVTRALSSALDHLTASRHIGLLFYLSQLTRFTVIGAQLKGQCI